MKKRVLLLTTSALVLACGAITASAEQNAGSLSMVPAPEPQIAEQPGSALILPPAQPQTTPQATNPEVPGTGLMLPGTALMLPPTQPQTPQQQHTDRDSPEAR